MTNKELKTLIARSGLTVTALAKGLGISRKTIYRWISGESKISRVVALGIKVYLKEE